MGGKRRKLQVKGKATSAKPSSRVSGGGGPKQQQQQQQQSRKQKKKSLEQQRRQRSHNQENLTIPFDADDQILLVGEGDLSFAASLVRHHRCGHVTATVLERDRAELVAKHPTAEANIAVLEATGGLLKSSGKKTADAGREDDDDDDDDTSVEHGVRHDANDAQDNQDEPNGGDKTGFSTAHMSNPLAAAAAAAVSHTNKGDSDSDSDSDSNTTDPDPNPDTSLAYQPQTNRLLYHIDVSRPLPASLLLRSRPLLFPCRNGSSSPRRRRRRLFDRILFNFPHVGGGKSTDVNRQVRHNQSLLVAFFRHAVAVLAPGGSIVVTLFEGEPYTLWNVRDLARHVGLEPQRSFRFFATAYPGYRLASRIFGVERSKKVGGGGGEGGGGGGTGEDRLARSFVFGRKGDVVREPGGDEQLRGQRKRKRKRGGDDDDDEESSDEDSY